jgi:hypothetical protein
MHRNAEQQIAGGGLLPLLGQLMSGFDASLTYEFLLSYEQGLNISESDKQRKKQAILL